MKNSLKYKSLRGMPDVLPEDAFLFFWIESTVRKIFNLFSYKEIRIPLLESTEVFTRSIGQDTDIVEKEMYTFEDRGGNRISLRPEGTASIIRAYIEHGWFNDADITKLYYIGPMFRGERPQKGRLRQFHQIGAELIGGADPYLDAELIFSLDTILKELGIGAFTILLNSLGCKNDRSKYKKILGQYLSLNSSGLCEDCGNRSVKNVLRVLDCKKKTCKAVVEKAPHILQYLCGKCREDYDELKKILSGLDVKFSEKKDLVRGLDYYTGSVFEVVHPLLGSQDAIAAGGRYDNLVYEMGGPDKGATGYALGMERLLLVLKENKKNMEVPGVLIVFVDPALKPDAFNVNTHFWKQGVKCEMDLSGRSFKGQMRKAHREKRKFVVIVGEDEMKEKKVLLKDMDTGEQRSISLNEAVKRIKKYFK
ncbi:MAG: histidine--tRNA ligase [Candidatus Omnitrophota bacterium]